MIFWPGGSMKGELYDVLRRAGFRFHLFSFYHERKRMFDREPLDPADFRMFADSGAFSAWTKSEHIDMQEYSAFVRYHAGYLEAYAALDVIPTSTQPAALEQAAALSWANYQDMLKDGLDPVPIYHYGESRKWLDMMLGSGCKYIGLGGMGNANRPQRKAWLDSAFKDLPDDIKVHGFGVSAIDLLFRYPWYSADSTTWLRYAAYGVLMIPIHDGTKFLFDRPPYQAHCKELLVSEDKVIGQWLDYVGITAEAADANYKPRMLCNAVFMREVTAHHIDTGPKKRSSTQQGFFK